MISDAFDHDANHWIATEITHNLNALCAQKLFIAGARIRRSMDSAKTKTGRAHFMKLTLSSAAIALTGALTLAACANAPTPVSSQKTQSSTIVTAKGGFTGDNKHIVTGNAVVSRVDGQWVITLDDGFTLDGAPDPKVALSSGGKYVEGTILGKLKSLQGSQSYALAEGLDIGDYDQV